MNKRSLMAMIALCAGVTASLAQGAGDQVIRIIVPLGPGTPSDSATRIVATRLSEILKRTVVVDNKPGANGVLAVQELMRAKPDGNTLMLGGVSPMAINVAMIRNLPYDPRRDFTPIGGIYNAFQAYLVNPALPVKTLPEFIAYAKKNPGKVTAGYYSALSQIQFAAMKSLADIDILMIPYKTTSNAYTDLGGGVIDATSEGAAQPWPTTPEAFAAHIDKEVARWTKLARDAGVQPE